MPRLLLFVPCRHAIINQQDNSLSIIGVIEGVTQSIPQAPAATLPADAHAPIPWDIVSLWLQEPGDESKRFEQRVQLVTPAGQELISAVLPFILPQANAKNLIQAATFPIGQAVTLKLKLSVREVAEGKPWTEVAEYPISVVHKQ